MIRNEIQEVPSKKCNSDLSFLGSDDLEVLLCKVPSLRCEVRCNNEGDIHIMDVDSRKPTCFPMFHFKFPTLQLETHTEDEKWLINTKNLTQVFCNS